MINDRVEKLVDSGKFPHLKKEKTKKFIKELPTNFFEKVIDLELKIKREFSMETLEELTYLYSVL